VSQTANGGPVKLDAGMSEALLAVLDACGIGAFLGDGRRLLEANASMCRLFGRDRDELLAIEPTTLLAPSDRTLMTERGRSWGGDVSIRAVSVLQPTGEPLPAMIASAAVREGLRVGVVIDLSDVTAAEFDLELFRSMADHSPAGVLLWDGRGVERGVDLRLRWASRPALALMLQDREDVVGQRLGDLLPFIPPTLADRALALCGTDRFEDIGEARLPFPRDTSRTLERTLIGLPAGLVAVRVVDVTEAREEERRRYALLRRVVELGDDDRRRLGLSLHDDAVQQAAAAAFLLEGLAQRPDVADRAERLHSASAAMHEVLDALRRIVFELSPPELIDSGLGPAIRNAFDYLFSSAPVELEIDVDATALALVSREVQTIAFRIAVEALTNVRKHADASRVSVGVVVSDGQLELTVTDDGVGLLPETELPAHPGLRNMIERAAAVGGSCTIVPRGTGGVEVFARLPWQAEAAPLLPVDLPATLEEATAAADEERQRGLEGAAAAFVAARSEAHDLRRRLQAVLETSQALSAAGLGQSDVVHLGASHAAAALACHATVHLLRGGAGDLVLAAAAETPLEVISVVERDVVEAGHARIALDSGLPFLIDGSEMDGSAEEIRQALVAPLLVAGQRLGALTLCRVGDDAPFRDDDVDFAAWLAAQIAAGLLLATA
jgi:signal transduction histidine kinase